MSTITNEDDVFKKMMQKIKELSCTAPDLKQLRKDALEIVKPHVGKQGNPTGTAWKYVIDGFVDTEMDEYWEIDEWINSLQFVQWLVKENKELGEKLHKDCVWELLEDNPSKAVRNIHSDVNRYVKDRELRNSITQKNNLDKPWDNDDC
jgi:hypothetical protein